jgi:hypothetical protein
MNDLHGKRKKESGMEYCASCRNGEIKEEADYKVKGKVWGNDRMIPYSAYICKDHFNMKLEDYAELTIVEWVSDKAKKERCEELVEKYTAYNSFKEMCKNNPTIRGFKGANFLRREYEKATT